MLPDQIFKYLSETPSETLILAFLLFFIGWIYKEYRNTYQKSEKEDLERIDKALELYGEFIIIINQCIRTGNMINDFLLKLSKGFPYFPQDIIEDVKAWDLSNDDNILNSIKAKMEREVEILKNEQNDCISKRSSYEFTVEKFFFLFRKEAVKNLVYGKGNTLFW